MLKELFGVEKPVIAMAHLKPLPGTPLYDERAGVSGILEPLAADLRLLLDGGVDAVMFCNEGDRPYALTADFEAVALMTRAITELAPRDRPFGVDFLWDPKAPLAIAQATGAAFVRGIFTGVYESDMGMWNTDAAAALRYRRQIGAGNVKMFFNVTPEFASSLGTRTDGERAHSAAVSSLADAILVSGPRAGAEPNLDTLREVRQAIGPDVPMLLNTGARADNIARYLEVADGVIVGTNLKVDGGTWNPVDGARVRAFMAAVRSARGT